MQDAEAQDITAEDCYGVLPHVVFHGVYGLGPSTLVTLVKSSSEIEADYVEDVSCVVPNVKPRWRFDLQA